MFFALPGGVRKDEAGGLGGANEDRRSLLAHLCAEKAALDDECLTASVKGRDNGEGTDWAGLRSGRLAQRGVTQRGYERRHE